MSAGSEFHTLGAATQKPRVPKLSLSDGTDNEKSSRRDANTARWLK